MATFLKRGSRWRVQVRRKGFPPICKTFALKSDAEIWARDKERAIDRAELPINVSELKATTVGDLLRRYRDTITPTKRGKKEEGYRLGTMLAHELALVSLSTLASGSAMSKLSPSSIASYRDDRLKIVSPCSVLKELAILHHVFALAIKEWNIPLANNPVALITKPQQHKARDRRLEQDELKALDAALAAQCPLAREVFLFAVATGMRRGEILGLTWSNIDLEARTAYLPMTKNGDSRSVPLSPSALAVLERLSPPDREGPVFAITKDALRYAFDKATKDADIEDFNFHDCRHEATSALFEAGLTIPEVQLFTGHKSLAMLSRYTNLRARDVAKKLEGLIL